MHVDIAGVRYVRTPDAAKMLGLSSVALRCQRSRHQEIVPSETFGSAVLYRLDLVELAAGHGRLR